MPSTAVYVISKSVASASGVFLPVGLLLPTGRPFPPTSGPVISRQWTYYLPQIGLFILRPTAYFSSIEPFIPLAGLLLPVASINNQFASVAEQNGSIPATRLLAISCLLGTSSKADTAHQKPNKGRKRKGQTGQQHRPKMRARSEANPAHQKPNKGRQRKGQTGQQHRPKMLARSKANPAHQKPNKGRQRKGQTGQQHRPKMRARSKANPAHQKPNKGRQRKGQTGQQYSPKMWSRSGTNQVKIHFYVHVQVHVQVQFLSKWSNNVHVLLEY
ncbi:hypothetical protein PHYBLDRAFT_139051 [Phycomyces blakesleeanus NRRL 1555(-)]|uniref:Uncharacterized protein n=1 Tax=Phycomyces blakesleeanus (strain ATCC 8743b / DSM 1359 / FGSC 10004 / NBRC 33097 / NRRL 1555) TaxID=763407 RepID=A0A162QAX6_PHYB8|nr:hypothetical protein PHYBLDRAFT_139051 [Phycomyces blakesleeanus NRRL 1555(-)]OAD81506.1 hypothetical protein PHYBLDRAFT_139051 [Phycomyces blakesleeanus NRRL 1555(-)]|eukprot:XP_018299546.1 hypothetical protein PHYBLDRAFT_139051 [Phycomyces blakesleeanus NRRL 1555(-)]